MRESKLIKQVKRINEKKLGIGRIYVLFTGKQVKLNVNKNDIRLQNSDDYFIYSHASRFHTFKTDNICHHY